MIEQEPGDKSAALDGLRFKSALHFFHRPDTGNGSDLVKIQARIRWRVGANPGHFQPVILIIDEQLTDGVFIPEVFPGGAGRQSDYKDASTWRRDCR